jgi:hypothetical protein
LKNNLPTNDTPTQYEEELQCMKERLARCLQLLKINHDNQISITAFKLIEKDIHKQTVEKTYFGQWITALNAIAGSCLLNQRALSHSEVYDFLTVAVTTSLENRTKVIDERIFRIYRDIMANYESADNKLKVAYPKIIVDVVAILAKGIDTSGKKIPIHNVEAYYQKRKSDISTTSSVPVAVPTATSATAASIKNINRKGEGPWARSEPIDYEEKYLNKNEEAELIENLNIITNRSKKEIQVSIAKLDRRDALRIKDLCKNYNKLQKYSKLITLDGDQQKFKVALENDIGKKLSEHQLHHAANSIRKAKLYIENVLDGKFIPHGSYGINHTKHNLEYGYLIVGLMQPSKRTTKK